MRAFLTDLEIIGCIFGENCWSVGAESLAKLVSVLPTPRIVWLMVPAGKPIDDTLFGEGGLMQILSPGDVIIDGGNSFYKDSIRRAEELKKRNIQFLDAGVSGGPGGARRGASLMIGGDAVTFRELEPLFRAIAIPGGYQFFQGAGAGHFVKMVHNGIEYGMMQAIAEGFEILRTSEYDLDLSRVADIYNHGSVIESRLVGWLLEAFEMYGAELQSVSGSVAHTGEGAWTVEAAKEMNLPAKVIEYALEFRKESEKNPSYAGKIVSALRNRFGGHSIG
jgi:6-phosphogluconate dehydrogenase